jgi:hypothetical protein
MQKACEATPIAEQKNLSVCAPEVHRAFAVAQKWQPMRARSRQWFAASDPNNAPAATPESPRAKIFETQNFSLQVIFGGMWRDEIPAAIERSIFPPVDF